MRCTNCKVETNNTITDVWNSKQGTLIREDETLCISCAKDRGYKSLKEINDERV